MAHTTPPPPLDQDSPTSPVDPPTFQEKVSAPFREYLKDQQELLDSGTERLEEHIELIRLWPHRKKKLDKIVLKPMQKWLTALKKIVLPLKNHKRYKKEKKRLLRSKYPAIYSRNGFNLKAFLGLLHVINILRITIILSFFLALLFLSGYFILRILGVL